MFLRIPHLIRILLLDAFLQRMYEIHHQCIMSLCCLDGLVVKIHFPIFARDPLEPSLFLLYFNKKNKHFL